VSCRERLGEQENDMPSLTFRLRKTADAAAQLILVRDDGTHSTGTVGPADG